MKAFKFVDSQYAEAFRTGEAIKLATFSHYREIEGPRHDPFDGAAVHFHDPVFSLRGVNETSTAARFAQGFLGFPAVAENAIIQDNIFVVSPAPALLFCASNSPAREAARKTDVCFEIVAFRALTIAISKALAKIAHPPTVRRVEYSERYFNVDKDGWRRSDPFIKEAQFSVEDEVRAMWPLSVTEAEIPLGMMIISCPKVAEYIRPYFS